MGNKRWLYYNQSIHFSSSHPGEIRNNTSWNHFGSTPFVWPSFLYWFVTLSLNNVVYFRFVSGVFGFPTISFRICGLFLFLYLHMLRLQITSSLCCMKISLSGNTFTFTPFTNLFFLSWGRALRYSQSVFLLLLGDFLFGRWWAYCHISRRALQ